MTYPDSIRDDIRDAEACIWYESTAKSLHDAILTCLLCRTLGKAHMPDNDIARRVSLDYTLAAAQVFQETCQKSFRFIYCSGAAAERDQAKPLWFMQEYRRIRVREHWLEPSKFH